MSQAQIDASRQFLSSSGFLKIYHNRLLLVWYVFNKHSLLSASITYVFNLYEQKLAVSSIICGLGSYVSVLQIPKNPLQVCVEEKQKGSLSVVRGTCILNYVACRSSRYVCKSWWIKCIFDLGWGLWIITVKIIHESKGHRQIVFPS